MALSQDEFFNQYWGGTAQAGQVQSYASGRVFDGSNWRSPTGGEIARLESDLKNWVRNNPSSGFQAAWAAYSGGAAVKAARAEASKAQEAAAAAAKEAQIAGKQSTAVAARVRSQSMLEQAQVQQAQIRAGQALHKQRRTSGATVGQPGRTRTRVASGLGIGGYGGTRAARVSPTGLNI